MTKFDLLNEPWIPCIDAKGTARELGILGTLEQAHLLREIADPSPLVAAALHRPLLAILHRVFGPPDWDAWKQLWRRGLFDAAPLKAYLEPLAPRFDLLEPQHPFYQTRGLTEAKTSPIQQIVFHLASGNNETLFDHSTDDRPAALAPASAARHLIAYQYFAVGGGKSVPFYLSHGPLTKGLNTLVQGGTLFETLMLNLMVLDPSGGLPITPSKAGQDCPVWERHPDDPPRQKGNHPRGWLDYLTWQSRRVELLWDRDAGAFTRCRILQGKDLPEGFRDPYIPYSKNPKTGFLPIPYSSDKAVWRNLHAFIQNFTAGDRESNRPAVMTHLGELEARGLVPAMEFTLSCCGMEADQAKKLAWGRKRIALPAAYLRREDLFEAVRDAIARADEHAARLGRIAWKYSEACLLTSNRTAADRALKEKVRAMADSLGLQRRFWGALEPPFKRLLHDLPGHQEAMEEWDRGLDRLLKATANEVFESIQPNPRNFRALALARQHY